MKDITYGVREFQAHVSEAIRAVQQGKRVIVYSRNEPVAEFVKPRKAGPNRTMSALDRKLERLFDSGVLSRPKKTGRIPPIKGVPMPGVVAQFLAERR
ncbi:MAG: hypothetical protein K8T20_03850 [Planctomycetes bacterium]|nr:hypothetical protein [Planctomycetota bacterium]